MLSSVGACSYLTINVSHTTHTPMPVLTVFPTGVWTYVVDALVCLVSHYHPLSYHYSTIDALWYHLYRYHCELVINSVHALHYITV